MRAHIPVYKISLSEQRWIGLWGCTLAVLMAGMWRYFTDASFWLDEAFVASSLRLPSVETLFSRLEYGQQFPRLYLACIAALREVGGFQTHILRLLPFLCFLAATLLWARLLALRSARSNFLNVLSGFLLLGATFWLEQSAQLKQYTFDVLLGLLPFWMDDEFWGAGLRNGKKKLWLVGFGLLCASSYTYPLCLAARVGGWYLVSARRSTWKLDPTALAGLVLSSLGGWWWIWSTDYSFARHDLQAVTAYWSQSILQVQLAEGAIPTIKLLSRFFWGWYSTKPVILAGLIPLQICGVYWVVRQWIVPKTDPDPGWGTRSCGSLMVLLGLVAASLWFQYPLSPGRLTLFTLIHIQIFALEGVTCVQHLVAKAHIRDGFLHVFLFLMAVATTLAFARFVISEPPENLRPMLATIRQTPIDTVWVHPCSVAQVQTLPEGLPVRNVLFGSEEIPRHQRILILWTHTGGGCDRQLDALRMQSVFWKDLHTGRNRGLAIAEF
ncbi:MAG TPA: hypothetical protein PLB18_06180 [Acidobacteriota bacterium]|nr:hypothetical protein [Acidobacteriota bacterium]HNJ38960.1 hypothetical protein [Acidobacteriota bacterium]